jgi:signal transduction histidine kinase
MYLDQFGRPQGAVIDYWNLWAERTGSKLRFELLPWTEVQDRFRQGHDDILLAAIKTPDRELWLDFSRPYLSVQLEAYVRNDMPGAGSAKKLKDLKGLQIGVLHVDSCQVYLSTNAPSGAVTTTYSTSQAMIDDAVAGHIDAFVGYPDEIAEALKRLHQQASFHSIADSRQTMDICAATRKGQKALLRRIDRGLALISLKERDAIWQRWRVQPEPASPLMRVLLLAALGLLAIAIVAILLYRLWVKRRLASLAQGLSQQAREKEQALAGMRFTEQRLKAFAEALSGVMMLLDGEGRCLDVLGSADRLPALRHVLLSGTIRQAMPREAAEAIMRAIGQAIAERELQVVEYELDGPTGKRAFEGRLTVIPESPPDRPLVVLLVLDVTDHKRLRDQLRQSQKMEAIGRMAGGVAHDFNNILTAMAGFVDLAAEDMEKRPKLARQSLDEIVKAIQRAADLTRQLLSFSHQQAIARRPLNLNDRACHIEKMLRRLIGESIQIRLELDPGLDLVLADPSQVDQMILNLAVNARDAMPAGGRLVIATRNADMQDQTRGPTGTLGPGYYVILEVSDTGIGIDSETIGRVFEPFFTTKSHDKGTGLGLSIVYGIVKQGGGDIACDSQLGKGTTFRVYFPRHQDGAADVAAAGAAAKIRSTLGPVTVMVVEDEPAARALVCRVLRENGFNVLETSDADQALRLFEASPKPIRLLVSDVVMPGMNGPELARRALLRSPGLKIILLSSYAGTNVKLPRDMAADAQILFKPFLPEDLIARVHKALDIPSEPAARL